MSKIKPINMSTEAEIDISTLKPMSQEREQELEQQLKDIESITVSDEYHYETDCPSNYHDFSDDLGLGSEVIHRALYCFFDLQEGMIMPHPISLFKSVDGIWYLQWMSRYYKVSDYRKTWCLPEDRDLIRASGH